jgi:hypothetical protein
MPVHNIDINFADLVLIFNGVPCVKTVWPGLTVSLVTYSFLYKSRHAMSNKRNIEVELYMGIFTGRIL